MSFTQQLKHIQLLSHMNGETKRFCFRSKRLRKQLSGISIKLLVKLVTADAFRGSFREERAVEACQLTD